MRPWDTYALTRPRFEESQFVPTEYYSSADKAWFANTLASFIAEGFPESKWTKRLYLKLMNSFGHIAHYNKQGFWETFFIDTRSKIDFLKQTMEWPCHGQPRYTCCDVERALIRRLTASGVAPYHHALRAAEIEGAERALLRMLRSKYEGIPSAPPPSPVPTPVHPKRSHGSQRENMDQRQASLI